MCSNLNISTDLLYRVFKSVILVDLKGRLQKFALTAYDFFLLFRKTNIKYESKTKLFFNTSIYI